MYQLPELSLLSGLAHGFSDAADGSMSFRFGDHDEVLQNRRNFLGALATNLDRSVAADVQHGVEIAAVDRTLTGRGMKDIADALKVDALMTNEQGLFLFLTTADCLPIILYDPRTRVIALVHASRINTPLGIVGKVIAKMQERYGTAPGDLVAGVGPAIHKGSYIFSLPELHKRFADESAWKDFLIETHPGETAVDLIGYNLEQLIDAGVPEHAIEVSDNDTAVDTRFFSHVRSHLTGEAEGRMATAAGMV